MTENDTQDLGNGMKVRLAKDGEPDLTIEDSAFDTMGVSVDNAVPIEALEDLVAQWRDDGIAIHVSNPYPSDTAGQKAADGLEEVIDDYRSEQ